MIADGQSQVLSEFLLGKPDDSKCRGKDSVNSVIVKKNNPEVNKL